MAFFSATMKYVGDAWSGTANEVLPDIGRPAR